MTLNNYLNKLVEQGLLKQEDIGLDQARSLLGGAIRNISAARKSLAIDEETCYIMAYNAMLKIARALVFLQGFRPIDGQQHKTTIKISGEILGKDFNQLIKRFDKMRRKRNQLIYDSLVPPSKKETKDALGVKCAPFSRHG